MELHLPVYAALTAGTILILQLGLMLSVGFKRIHYQQGIGDGGHADLALRVRRHGNLAENAGIFVVVLALVEILGGNAHAVATIGAAFVVVRVAHAIGLSRGDGPNAARFIGAMGTVATGFGTGAYACYLALAAL